MPSCSQKGRDCVSTCQLIADAELLIRFILDPRHVEDPITKKIKPNYIDLDELKHSFGVSVYRKSTLTQPELIEACRCIPRETVSKVGICAAANVRSIRADGSTGERCFMVCPSPRRKRPSHADIFWSFFVDGMDDSHVLKFRKALIDAIGVLLPYADFANGLPNQALSVDLV